MESTRKKVQKKVKKRSIKSKRKISYSKKFHGGAPGEFIIVDGTSSSGKTKICNFFKGLPPSPENGNTFKCIMTDEYQPIVMVQFYKDLPNNYIDNEPKEALFVELLCDTMVHDAITAGRAVLDDISQTGLLKAFKNARRIDDVFVLVVYAGLNDLARNINSRRLEGDYRGMFVFTQFAERYIICSEKDGIDTINKVEFIALLKANFKFEFASEKDLIVFADEVFIKMGIEDEKEYYIKLRDEYRCDYLLNTTGKSPEMIYAELQRKFT
jgi:hypothetical protein